MIRLAAVTTFGLMGAVPNAQADPVADFYKGKTVTIQVGYGPGGGYDVTARLIAQFLGDHIPGKPRVIVQNVPGAGSLKVANAIANSTPNDGLTLGVFAFDVALQPFYGEALAMFDPAKFAWIGSMDTDNPYCGVWKGAGLGLKSLRDVITSSKTLSFGSSAPGALPTVYPLFLKNALGAPVKVIYGYPGSKDVVLAMRRGEVDGACGIFESLLRSAYAEDVKSGDLQVFMQSASDEPSPLFPDASPVSTVIKTDELRDVARLVFGPVTITRPLVAPPGTPKDRVEALRQALMDTVKDPQALAAGEKMNISLQPKSAGEIEAVIAAFKSAPPELLKKAFSLTHDP
jgi:tripartite-type tricarboxylate transporter receptor subunit TctC